MRRFGLQWQLAKQYQHGLQDGPRWGHDQHAGQGNKATQLHTRKWAAFISTPCQGSQTAQGFQCMARAGFMGGRQRQKKKKHARGLRVAFTCREWQGGHKVHVEVEAPLHANKGWASSRFQHNAAKLHIGNVGRLHSQTK